MRNQELETIGDLLQLHAEVLGPDRMAYENHAFRVATFCVALLDSAPSTDTVEKIAIAAAFHDIGIWTAGTFDYLDPSIETARAHVEGLGRPEWLPEIETMIREHHRIRSLNGRGDGLGERFRRADWVDVTLGARRFGLPFHLVRDAFRRHPDAGFHWKLVKLTVKQARHHPLRPIPVLKW